MLLPRLGQCAHYPSKHLPILNVDHCKVMYTLCIAVSSSLPSLSKVWSRQIGLCYFLLRVLSVLTLEHRFCSLCCLAPSHFDLFGVTFSWGRVWKFPVLHDEELLCFDFSGQIRHTLRRRCIIDCMPTDSSAAVRLSTYLTEGEEQKEVL